jgi:hypothetical protein
MITQGFEHKLYFRLISLGLPKGIEFIAEDTARRKAYLDDNPNFPNNIVLTSCLTYCENVLNSGNNSNDWINNHGGIFIDILLAMKIVRNALTHNNGNISQNHNINGMNGNQQYVYAKSTLQSNAIDSACYEFDDSSTTINVLPNGCGRISAICKSVFKNAGVIIVT